MQTTTSELPLNASLTEARPSFADPTMDELARLKHQLLQAEVRRARARAAMAGAEADVKVLNSRLKALAK